MIYKCNSCVSLVGNDRVVQSSEGFNCYECTKLDKQLDIMILKGKLNELKENK